MSQIKWKTVNEYYSTKTGTQLEEGHARSGSFIIRIINEEKSIQNGNGRIKRTWECTPQYSKDLFGRTTDE